MDNDSKLQELFVQAAIDNDAKIEKRLTAEVERRNAFIDKLENASVVQQTLVKDICASDILLWCRDFVYIENPKLKTIKTIPLMLRPKQQEFLESYIPMLLERKGNGVVEKSREEGASWLTAVYFIHQWLFVDGWKGSIGAAKLSQVDVKGDPDSLIEKMRIVIRHLPKFMLPKGYNELKHSSYLKIINPESKAVITGSGGEQVGRGGRSTIMVVDETAHIPAADSVLSSLSANSDTVVYISTPKGVGNLFHTLRTTSPDDYVFIMDWKENPDKCYTVTLDGKTYYPWYELLKSKYPAWLMAQEVDRDYSASVKGVIIPLEYVHSARKYISSSSSEDICTAGLDVSDEWTSGSGDKTVYASRRGSRVLRIEAVTGSDSIPQIEQLSRKDGIQRLCYDKLGVGAAVSSTLAQQQLPFIVKGVANSSRPTTIVYSDSEAAANKRFTNFGTELIYRLRDRLYRTHRHVNGIEEYPDDELISFADLPMKTYHILEQQCCQPIAKQSSTGKIQANKHGASKSSKSPDYLDALMYCFADETPNFNVETVGSFSF